VQRWKSLESSNKALLAELVNSLTGVFNQHEALMTDFKTLETMHKDSVTLLEETRQSRKTLQSQCEENSAVVAKLLREKTEVKDELLEVKQSLYRKE
jgi:chromosome segregation ATPase